MMNKMYGQQGMGPEIADAILRNADRRTQSSIPRRDPRMNPPVNRSISGPYNEVIERVEGDPNLARISEQKEQEYVEAGFSPRIASFLAVMEAFELSQGQADLRRGAVNRQGLPRTREQIDQARQRGAAMRTTTRGYNAP